MRYPIHVAVMVAALALAGCASTPVKLVALPAPTSTVTAPETSAPTILLRPVAVPAYLETFPVVMDRANGAVVVSDGTEWAERFSDGVARVLRDALARRVGAERVLITRGGRIPDAESHDRIPVFGSSRRDAQSRCAMVFRLRDASAEQRWAHALWRCRSHGPRLRPLQMPRPRR